MRVKELKNNIAVWKSIKKYKNCTRTSYWKCKYWSSGKRVNKIKINVKKYNYLIKKYS